MHNSMHLSFHMTWRENQPIYLQLREKIVMSILNGTFPEGSALPSIRTLATQFQLNHLTVTKAIQTLVEDDILEKQRGIGMYVRPEAVKKLSAAEKEYFLTVEWPAIVAKIHQLNLSPEDLFYDTSS